LAEAQPARKRAVPAARPRANAAAAKPSAAKAPAPRASAPRVQPANARATKAPAPTAAAAKGLTSEAPSPRGSTPQAAARRTSPRVIDDEPVTPNYALRLTEGLPDAEPAESQDSFALRLNEALEAINAANGITKPAAAVSQPDAAGTRGWLAALDKLPPIRLPIGPAIPWKIGLPALVALVLIMGVTSRTAGGADMQGVQLPAQQTYPVQQEAPLFAKPQAADPSAASQQSADSSATGAASAQAADSSDPSAAAPEAADASGVSPAAAPQQAIGVPDAAAMGGFDLVDIGIKLVAVLALAYGSLMLLKKLGYGGAGAGLRGGSSGADVRVVSTIALAPNRSVHVIAIPGGKTLLVGATPTAVNLLAELPPES
jgi:flagellar biogenesis protein FliO